MKNEKGGKINTKTATAALKSYLYVVQKHDYEIKGLEFKKAKGIKTSSRANIF